MRNLVIVTHAVRDLPYKTTPSTDSNGPNKVTQEKNAAVVAVASFYSSTSATNIAVLLADGQVHILDEDLQLLHCYTLAQQTGAHTTAWKALMYFPDTEHIACFSADGRIVELVHDELTEVGAIENGIVAVAQSPDQERLAIVTGNHTMLIMSSTWEVIEETPLPEAELDAAAGLAWRFDGSCIALLSCDAVDKLYRLRVFDATCGLELHSVGRNEDDSPLKDLEGGHGAVAWATNGSIIGCFQRTRRKSQIAFFEKNGLRHRELVLQIGSTTEEQLNVAVQALSWNVESDLLAVLLRLHDGTSAVQLYHRGNYHWYLKQQWEYGPLAVVSFVSFDAEKPYRMYQGWFSVDQLAGGKPSIFVSIIDVVWDHTVSMSPEATAVVVDGCALNLTEIGCAMIPPPMCAGSFTLPSPCRHVSFLSTSEHLESWLFVCACSDGHVLVLDQGAPATKRFQQPSCHISFRIQDLSWDAPVHPWMVRQVILGAYHKRDYLAVYLLCTLPVEG
jgi:elongator complex protein 1